MTEHRLTTDDDDGHTERRTLAFLGSLRGAVAGLIAVIAATAAATLWAAGIIGLPDRMASAEGRIMKIENATNRIENDVAWSRYRMEWTICTREPRPSYAVLRALQVECNSRAVRLSEEQE